MRKVLAVLGVLLLAAVALVYFLGRGKVEQKLEAVERPPVLGEDTRLESVALYFGAPHKIALRSETRTVVAGPSLSNRLAVCIQELAAGSLAGGLSVLPRDTRLRNAYLDPLGLAYLDFDRTILAVKPGGEEWLAVASVVRTVCGNYPAVRRVRFMVDGQVMTSLSGSMDLEEPLSAGDFPLGADTP